MSLSTLVLRQRQSWIESNPPGVIQEGREQDFLPMPAGVSTADGVLWRGQGVSGGLVTGPARILRSPEGGHRLAVGDILLAATTDPGWTPVFLRAGAVVVETGGFLSHGAIVAREFGLPAVVNVAGLLEAIPDGTMLEVERCVDCPEAARAVQESLINLTPDPEIHKYPASFVWSSRAGTNVGY